MVKAENGKQKAQEHVDEKVFLEAAPKRASEGDARRADRPMAAANNILRR